jgi:hypothetical protein
MCENSLITSPNALDRCAVEGAFTINTYSLRNNSEAVGDTRTSGD